MRFHHYPTHKMVMHAYSGTSMGWLSVSLHTGVFPLVILLAFAMQFLPAPLKIEKPVGPRLSWTGFGVFRFSH
jgi:hypothetical protein